MESIDTFNFPRPTHQPRVALATRTVSRELT
jgi:hypothetical protein